MSPKPHTVDCVKQWLSGEEGGKKKEKKRHAAFQTSHLTKVATDLNVGYKRNTIN